VTSLLAARSDMGKRSVQRAALATSELLRDTGLQPVRETRTLQKPRLS
jgi:hypothetical protein